MLTLLHICPHTHFHLSMGEGKYGTILRECKYILIVFQKALNVQTPSLLLVLVSMTMIFNNTKK